MSKGGGGRNPAAEKEDKVRKGVFGRKISDAERWLYGLVMLFMSVFVLVAVVSYYFTWSDDQSIIRDGLAWSAVMNVSNGAGKLGAFIGATLVGRLFGAFALGVPIIFIILSLRIMRVKPLFLDRSVRITLMIMILGSLTLGYMFGTNWGVFGSGLGGEAAIASSAWLVSLLGKVGFAILLVMAWVLLAIYINRNTIKAVKGLSDAVSKRASKMLKNTEKSAARQQAKEEKRREKEEKAAAENQPKQEDGADDIRIVEPTAEVAMSADPAMTIKRGEEEDAKPAEDAPATSPLLPKGGVTVIEDANAASATMSPVTPATDEMPMSSVTPATTIPGGVVIDTLPWEDDGISIISNDGVIKEQTVGQPEPTVAPAEEGDDDEDFVVLNSFGQRVNASSLREGEVAQAQQQQAQAQQPAVGEQQQEQPAKEERESVLVGAGGVLESGGDGVEVIQTEYNDAEASAKELDAALYDPTLELRDYQRPPVELLEDHSTGVKISDEEIIANQEVIREKLADFGIAIHEKIKATVGPTVTLYEIEPAQGVKISRIRNLEEDIALALRVQSIRIMTLGAAGRGTVGIEVPNSKREVVSMYSVIKSIKFQDCKYKLPIVLGKTIYNEIYIGDLAKMPHLLVAGATGQGKSVGLNAIITSLLYKKHPAELKFVLVDPKQVELSVYSKLEKHFLAKMESEDNAILTDTAKVVYTLNSLVNLMEERYTLLNMAGERNISDYNEKFLNRRLNPQKGHQFLPYIVVVIDEFADMIMTAGKEVEIPITRLAAKARAVGIHLIVATQRPDVKVITGLIKSNIPARIAFKVVSMVDSRTIIDQPGANNLVGMGDMLMSINGDLTRIQCAFVDTEEIERLTEFIGKQKGYSEPYPLPDYTPPEAAGSGSASKDDFGKTDEMFAEIARWVVSNQQGSTSAIQRNFELGYNRAGRITDQLHKAGIVGPPNGSKPREVLIYDAGTLEQILIDLDL